MGNKGVESSDKSVVSFNSVDFSYGDRKVLDGVSFKVSSGEVHGLIGPNGAGKSSTIKLISKLIQPHLGEVQISGGIGLMPESPALYSEMVVEDYLKFIYSIYRGPDQTSIKVEEVLKKYSIKNLQKRLIKNLSHGNRQKVSFAAAVIYNPDILILDEPTNGLDPLVKKSFKENIKELSGDHTIIISSHNLADISELCDSVTIIFDGKIKYTGELSPLLQKYQNIEEMFESFIN